MRLIPVTHLSCHCSFVPLNNPPLSLPFLPFGNHLSALCICESVLFPNTCSLVLFSRCCMSVRSCGICLSASDLFHSASCPRGHLCCPERRDCRLYGSVILYTHTHTHTYKHTHSISSIFNTYIYFYTIYNSIIYVLCTISFQSCPTLCDPMDSIPCQAPVSLEFSRQEHWSGLPCLLPGDLPDLGIQPMSLSLMHCRQVL